MQRWLFSSVSSFGLHPDSILGIIGNGGGVWVEGWFCGARERSRVLGLVGSCGCDRTPEVVSAVGFIIGEDNEDGSEHIPHRLDIIVGGAANDHGETG